jgi:tRNA (guanine37-N1)-methyltransferase
VRPYNVDGHKFIKTATYDLLYADHLTRVPVYRTRQDRDKRRPFKELSLPRTFSHYVMNLPASATKFLPSFIGLYSTAIDPSRATTGSDAGDLPTNPRHLFKPFTTSAMPMIHVYCFNTKSDDNVREQKAICEEISEQLDFLVTTETPELSITNVRDVAPNKCMFRASFRLPESVAFKGLED